jgi:hypothetical protein
MPPRLRLWLVALPLLVAGSEGAHALLDSFAPRSYLGAEVLHGSGAGQVAAFAALALGLVAAALAGELTARLRGRPGLARTPGRVAAAIPLALFAVQEHVEYGAGHGHVALLVTRRGTPAGAGSHGRPHPPAAVAATPSFRRPSASGRSSAAGRA